METTYTFRKTEATEALKKHAEDKLAKLDKYIPKPIKAHVIFNIEGANHIVEIDFNSMGVRYFSKGISSDMYASIDNAVLKIEQQLRKKKERLKSHKGQ